MDSLDDVIDGDVEQTVIEGLYLHGAAGQSLAQGNGVHKKEVVILPAEARVQLLLHDEDDIGWDDVGALVPFLLKSDPSALPPARLHINSEDLVLDGRGVPILIQHL